MRSHDLLVMLCERNRAWWNMESTQLPHCAHGSDKWRSNWIWGEMLYIWTLKKSLETSQISGWSTSDNWSTSSQRSNFFENATGRNSWKMKWVPPGCHNSQMASFALPEGNVSFNNELFRSSGPESLIASHRNRFCYWRWQHCALPSASY